MPKMLRKAKSSVLRLFAWIGFLKREILYRKCHLCGTSLDEDVLGTLRVNSDSFKRMICPECREMSPYRRHKKRLVPFWAGSLLSYVIILSWLGLVVSVALNILYSGAVYRFIAVFFSILTVGVSLKASKK